VDRELAIALAHIRPGRVWLDGVLLLQLLREELNGSLFFGMRPRQLDDQGVRKKRLPPFVVLILELIEPDTDRTSLVEPLGVGGMS
jgi:hypothetical protein